MTRSTAILFGCLILLLIPRGAASQEEEPVIHSFTLDGDEFLLDGNKFFIHSGELDYARIPREYWADRLHKMRAMGLNTVTTSAFWNRHESLPGQFTFSDNLDVAEFVRIAQQVGLWVIIKVGPYVGSGIDMGGLPSWLLRNDHIGLRTHDPRFLNPALEYLKRLSEAIVPLQIDSTGPVIMLQIEEAYGSFGDDEKYLPAVVKALREAGIVVPFFTSDLPELSSLALGAAPDGFSAIVVRSSPDKAFRKLEDYRDDVPRYAASYGDPEATVGVIPADRQDLSSQLDGVRWMVENGVSFNIQKFDGGTNFGWMGGARMDTSFRPFMTDPRAGDPLDAVGNPTSGYLAYRDLLKQYQPDGSILPEVPWPTKGISIPEIPLKYESDLFASVPPALGVPQLRTMEELGQDYGMIIYQTRLRVREGGMLTITKPHDLALVYLDGKFIGSIDRRKGETALVLPSSDSERPLLDILVNPMGRVSSGPQLTDSKGITDRVTLNNVSLMNWKVYQVRLRPEESAFRKKGEDRDGPRFFRGSFQVTDTLDTFLDMSAWSMGYVWVNGHHLGRFDTEENEKSLYVPGPWLRRGENEVLLLDLFRKEPATLKATASPITTP